MWIAPALSDALTGLARKNNATQAKAWAKFPKALPAETAFRIRQAPGLCFQGLPGPAFLKLLPSIFGNNAAQRVNIAPF